MIVATNRPKSREGLEQIGIRVKVDDLLELLRSQAETLGLGGPAVDQGGQPEAQAGEGDDEVLELPAGDFKPAAKWEQAVYKMGAKGKLPAWENSATRFQHGEHP